jgi:hypothetical protein
MSSPEVGEAAASGVIRRLPTCSLRRLECLVQKFLAERLLIHVNAPTLAINHHANEVGLDRGNVVAGDVEEQHGPQKGRVLIGIEKIQRAVAQQGLVVN